jgi:hypothetical protein
MSYLAFSNTLSLVVFSSEGIFQLIAAPVSNFSSGCSLVADLY